MKLIESQKLKVIYMSSRHCFARGGISGECELEQVERFLVSASWRILGMTIVILNFAFLILNSRFAFAQNVSYPIPQLGNCRDQKECKLYCDVPQNTPACWSWGKYVMNRDVLGETVANITYPIPELGNCQSPQACFLYCSQPKNQEACVSFARQNGLITEEGDELDDDIDEQELLEDAEEELGCTSRDACMALCSDPTNMDKCRAFAKKHGLDKSDHGPSPSVMAAAREDLGCDSETSCMRFCEDPENQNKCFEFAKKHGMMKEEDAKRMEKMMERKKQMMEAAKEELGCDSYESCAEICSQEANQEKCMNLGKRFGMMKSEVRLQGRQTLPCTSEDECKKYCQAHPNECPGMSGRPNYNASEKSLMQPMRVEEQKGDYLGPSGCRTEEECREYCKKHPDQCPGFPKQSTSQSQTTPMYTKPSLYPTFYPTKYEEYKPSAANTTSNTTYYPTYYPQGDSTGAYQNYPSPNPSEYPR